MDYISTKEAAQRWGISERRVRSLCSEGKIEGAVRCGDWVWTIPAGTQKPADGRTLRYMKNRSLRTGNQDYKEVDKLRSSLNQSSLTTDRKVEIVLEALCYDNTDITLENVLQIFNLENQPDVPLTKQIMALNMRSTLSAIPFDLNEKKLLELHHRLLMSIDERSAGYYRMGGNQAQETEAMFEQYAGPWSVLHPVARAAFLFAEILRIQPFDKGTAELAFVLLANEMYKAKLPPALFGANQVPELKAALASTAIRGNSQMLVQMIIDAVTGNIQK
ncbi:MAG: helix-turn-helix domain-containing protein [Sphaerochaetaceae bacterium]|nr:helix-turn-helix domain-containing protein [Sphaerochaetaceae bacterium]